jgi:hypothetical protein
MTAATGSEPNSIEPAEAVDEVAVEEELPPPDEDPGELPPPAVDPADARQLFYDPAFAWRAAVALSVVFALLAWPMWILAARLIFGGRALDRFPAAVAVTLVLVAIALAVGSLYLALIEFRARLRAVAAAAPEVRTRGIGTDVVKAAPDILKAFGQLTTVASILVVATVLFICGTLLAWHGLHVP